MAATPDDIFRSLVEASTDFIGTIDGDGRLLYLNPAGRRMLEIPLDEDVTGQSVFPYNDHPSEETRRLAQSVLDNKTTDTLNVFVSRSGRRIPVSQSFIVHETSLGTRYSTIARDITERLALEESLRAQADQDPLTGLLNRAALTRKISERTRTANSQLVMFDLDRFKLVNDERGHHAGDAVLIALANVLRAEFAEDSLVARLGGDEFAIVTGSERVHDLAEMLRPILEPVGAGVSLGVTSFDDSVPLEVALRRADELLYEHKRLQRLDHQKIMGSSSNRLVRA